MARNNYWQHPNVNAKPQRLNNVSMIGSNIIKSATLVANIASSATVGKPLLVPEYNCPWANEYRAECLPLMAAYGRLQDWDGLLFFAYNFRKGNREALTNFGTQSDPVHWGQIPLAALVFLRGDVAVARNRVDVGISTVDCFSARPQRTADRYSPYRVLPYISKLRNAYFDKQYEGDADAVIASGHSSGGDYRQAKHAIVFADWPYADETASKPDRGLAARQTCPGLRTATGSGVFDTQLVRDSLPVKSELIERNGALVGCYNDRFCLFPCASADEDKDPAWLHRLYLQMAGRWKLPGSYSSDEAGSVFRSDTGELMLDGQRKVFTAAAPNVVIATGYLAAAGDLTLGKVTLTCKTLFASISVLSLDGKPLERSARMLLTAVARAENTGQVITAITRQGAAEGQAVDADTGVALRTGQFALSEPGRPPVLAEPVDAHVRLATSVKLKAFPLSPRGQRQEPLPMIVDGSIEVHTERARSPWILLTVE
jgi:hypothetical protein